MTPVQLVLSKLPDAKPNGAGWQARCPAHDDRRPSLSIAEGTDGRALVTCHANCKVEEVVSALGLVMADLMPANVDGNRRKRKPPSAPPKTYDTARDAVAELEQRHGRRKTGFR